MFRPTINNAPLTWAELKHSTSRNGELSGPDSRTSWSLVASPGYKSNQAHEVHHEELAATQEDAGIQETGYQKSSGKHAHQEQTRGLRVSTVEALKGDETQHQEHRFRFKD
jgi:hypothetical protein